MVELFDYNEETYTKVMHEWKSNNLLGIIQATGTGKGYIVSKIAEDFPLLNKVVLCPNKYVIYNLKKISSSLKNIRYMTYSKLSFMTEEEIKELDLGMIFLDEFHRCGAEVWGAGVQKLLKAFPDAKVLGTTATPIRYLDNMRDMSDELFDGHIVSELTLVDAIAKGILPLPKYISAIYSFDEQKYLLSKESYYERINKLKLKLENGKGISSILKKHLTIKDNKFIIFCKNIEHLEIMRPIIFDWFIDAHIFNYVESYSVHSENNDNELLLEKFNLPTIRGNVKLMFSIDMLKEGLHVEDTNVILLRETMSPITYYQQIGRALDASNRDSTPLIIDLVNNFSNISSLKSDLKEAYELTRLHNIKDKTNDIDFFIIDETVDARKMFEELESQIIDNWEYFYDKYRTYTKNGEPTSKNKPLSHWISNQRFLGNNDELSDERTRLLIESGFDFDLSWEAKYQKYIEALNEDESGIVRGGKFNREYNWISSQRNMYLNDELTDEQIDKLESVEIVWNKLEDGRAFKLKILKEYGDLTEVVNTTTYNGYPIGKWLNYLRRMKHTITAREIKILKNLGYDVNRGQDDNWLDISRITENEIIKHKYIKYNHVSPCGKNVGEWLKVQNKLLSDGKLDDRKALIIKNINSLRVTKQEIDELKWKEMYDKYKKHIEETGNYIVPKKADLQLAKWTHHQKRKFREDRLPEKHKKMLLKAGLDLS